MKSRNHSVEMGELRNEKIAKTVQSMSVLVQPFVGMDKLKKLKTVVTVMKMFHSA